MKRLNNVKVQKRVVLYFMIVLVLAGVSGSVGAVFLMRAVHVGRLLAENGFSQEEIGMFKIDLYRESALVRDIALLTEEKDIQAASAELEDLQVKVNDKLEQLKMKCQNSQELKHIKLIDEKLPQYRKSCEIIMGMGLADPKEDALKLFRVEADPLLNQMLDAADAVRDLKAAYSIDIEAALKAQSRIAVIIIFSVIGITACVSFIFAAVIAKVLSQSGQ